MSERPFEESIPTVDEHGATVQRMFSTISHGYDRANRWMSMGTDIRWRRQAVAAMLPKDAGDKPNILDLCAGTLDSTMEIHKQYPHAKVTGGDFSAGMIENGRHKITPDIADRVHAAQMDAHSLPFDDRSLDAIFCAFGVRNLSDLPLATREQARCLRPGGELTVLEFFRPTSLFTRAFHGAYNNTMLPVVGWLATGNLDAYLYLPRSIGAFQTTESYRELLEANGFTNVRIQDLTFGVASVVRATRT